MVGKYRIVYTKNATKDIPKLKAARLDGKARALIDIIRNDPYQNPPPVRKTARAASRCLFPADQRAASPCVRSRGGRENRKDRESLVALRILTKRDRSFPIPFLVLFVLLEKEAVSGLPLSF